MAPHEFTHWNHAGNTTLMPPTLLYSRIVFILLGAKGFASTNAITGCGCCYCCCRCHCCRCHRCRLCLAFSFSLATFTHGSPYFGVILVFILYLYTEIFMLIFCINAEPDYSLFLFHWFLNKVSMKDSYVMWCNWAKDGEGVVWSCTLRVHAYVIWQRRFGLCGSWYLCLLHLMFLTYL